MSRDRFSLAVCQLRTETEYEATMTKVSSMILVAASAGADVVVLPEMFSCPYSSEYFHVFAEQGHEETVRRLSDLAAEHHVLLIGGSVPETDGNRLYNTSFVFDSSGELIARHRKIHLF